ncbi:MAG: protein kinase [Nannocystaceae bacterium]
MSVARQLGRYRIGERIGTGGVADVYRAEVAGAAGFSKSVVIKCLRPHVADEPELIEGLTREAKLAQHLQHGNIVQVFDFGAQDGQPFVVMEHVDGCSLHELQRDLARRGEPMGLGEALFVVEELAAALRYAHGLADEQGRPRGIVHRDVKPRNVLISRDGVVKLTDFGIAKVADDHGHTLPGVIKGTLAYLAPEQAAGQTVDARADLFALGLVLGELVLADEHTGDGPPVDARVDDALRSVIERATSREPEARWPDADAMLRALQRWRATRDVDAGPGQLAAWVRRARGQPPVAAAIALDAALLGGSDRGVTSPTAAQPLAPTAAEPTDEPSAPGRLRPGWMALAVAFALVGVAWATMGSRERDEITTRPDLQKPSSATPSTPALARRPATDAAATEEPTEPLAPAIPTPEPATPPGLDASDEPPPRSTSPRSRSRPRPELPPGRLQVNVLPWAEVSIDGRPRGRVPVDVELSAGPHRVELYNPQLGRVIKDIELRAGGQLKIKEW